MHEAFRTGTVCARRDRAPFQAGRRGSGRNGLSLPDHRHRRPYGDRGNADGLPGPVRGLETVCAAAGHVPQRNRSEEVSAGYPAHAFCAGVGGGNPAGPAGGGVPAGGRREHAGTPTQVKVAFEASFN